MRSSGDIFEKMTTQIRKHVNIVIMRENRKAEEEEKQKNEAKLTALWESTKFLIDDACKAHLDKMQLLLDLKVTETGLC